MLTGSIVTIVIPMGKKGNVCRASLKKLIDYHVASGTSTTVSVGTTDESATLNHDGHAGAVMMTLDLAGGRIPVVAGTGANATAEAISLTQCFNDSGIVDYLTVTPYYNRPSQEGLYQYFKVIAKHTDLSQILYNAPSHASCGLLPEMVDRLAKVKNIIEIKEATGNLTCVNQIKEPISDDFALLSNDGTSALDFMQLGGHGTISVTTNVAARDMAQMYKLAAEGHLAETRIVNQCLVPLHSKLFVEPSPIPVKWACKELGPVTTDTLRLPMTPITNSGRETVRAALKHASLL